MFNNKREDKVDGINCTVSTCNYHGNGNTCNAGHIQVGTEYALDRSETFCSTFENKDTY